MLMSLGDKHYTILILHSQHLKGVLLASPNKCHLKSCFKYLEIEDVL